jgi:hypothetical protein
MNEQGQKQIHWLRIPALFLRSAMIGLIRLYQLTLSRLLGPRCRFYPTCSEYMIRAIRKDGLLLGVWRGLKRLLRCHPLHPGGYDPP